MKRAILVLTIFFLSAILPSPAISADPDRYLGDGAIYTADDSNTSRPKPNVLFIIDNSKASLNTAAGVPYDPATVYPVVDAASWSIYSGDNQGDFTRVQVLNPATTSTASSPFLENLTADSCADIIRTRLAERGMYTGNGTTGAPNIRNGACDYGPTGTVYAIGNYLNFTNQTSGTGSGGADYVIVEVTYSVTTVTGNSTRTTTKTDRFELTAGHTAAEANMPGSGAAWQSYWALVGNSDHRASNGTWAVGAEFAVAGAAEGEEAQGLSQREIMYNALEMVIDGARGAVHFGAMTYGGNNQGGKIVYDVADLSVETAFNAFLAAIPGPGASDGEPVLSSQTGRPQAESLYDAGHYFKALYPGTQQSVTETGQVPSAIDNGCGYNHIILLTNGLSNGDSGSAASLGQIGDYDGDYYPDADAPDEETYGEGSHYLDDVASFLHVNHGISVHTVLAFQSDDDLVAKAAAEGDGRYYNVYNAEELTEALIKLLANIVNETSTSFVAPVVPASTTNRTISSNRVYLGLFKPQSGEPWLGNLKKYKVSSSLSLLDKNGNAATDSNGDFIESSESFWGTDSSGAIMSFDGALPIVAGGTEGDGGNVAAGGAGGSLKARVLAALAGTPDYEPRDLYTYLPGASSSTTLTDSGNAFSTDNSAITATLLDVADDTEKNDLIRFLQGFEDANLDGTLEARSWVMGDVLHSKPLVFNYSSYTDASENDCGANTSRIYVGANDGMLHAFRDCDGSEEWAFLPDNVLGQLKNLRDDSSHSYYIDGPPTAYVHDTDDDGVIESDDGDKVILIFGQRRGGGIDTLAGDSVSRGAYYALDVSVPTAPKFLWKIDNQTLAGGVKKFIELGETWGQPRLAKMMIGTAVKVVALFGAGYDNNEDLRYGATAHFPDGTDETTSTSAVSADAGDTVSSGTRTDGYSPKGRGIFAVEVATLKTNPSTPSDATLRPDFTDSGGYIWRQTFAENSDITSSIPMGLTVLDWNNDGYSDLIYAGDTGGNMWRFDVESATTSSWTAKRIFSSNSSTSKGRKIFFKPAVARYEGHPVLYFGTGDRTHPLNRNVEDRLYAVIDKGQATADAIDESNLVDVTLDRLQNASSDSGQEALVAAIEARLLAGHGWFIKLEKTGTFAHPGEKVLAPSLVFNGEAFFTTYTPNSSGSTDPCEVGNLGVSRLYQLDYASGSALANFDTTNDISDAENELTDGGDLGRGDRFNTIGSGIPSGIVVLIDASGKVSLMISSSNKVGTYQAPDAKIISPVYWMQW